MVMSSADSQESSNAGKSFQCIKTSVPGAAVAGRTPCTSNGSTMSSKLAVRVDWMEGQIG